jgi:dTDP-4-dehydrorhamnose 3,5-epimerase
VIFKETPLQGACLIEPERLEDARGFFARTFCMAEFKAHGLNPHVVQCSVSVSLNRGTLRGMHYQVAPHDETKLVRCTRGAIYDVIVDLRPESPTYLKHLAVELSEENRLELYVPGQFAHGFVTLKENTEVFYQMSEFFTPAAATGVRWNDPAFGIPWPVGDPILSDRDRQWPDFQKTQQTAGA